MAAKLQTITELYNETIASITQSPEQWQSFLQAAARNYKLPFDEQLLVFAQRPDATAVLELQHWNNKFARWVKRGSTGIAVFDNTSTYPRVRYYFDIADTNESEHSRPVPLWQAPAGYVPNLDIAVLVEDNLLDYTEELAALAPDFDPAVFHQVVLESVNFMVHTRCGIELLAPDFDALAQFDTPMLVNALGTAVSDIAEMGLREVIRTIANDEQMRYTGEKSEKEHDYEPNHDTSEWLPHPERDDARTTEHAPQPLGQSEIEPPAAEHENPAPPPDDPRPAVAAPARDAADSAGSAGFADHADGEITGRDGGTQGEQSAGVAGADEQHQRPSRGAGHAGAGVQLSLFPTQEQQIAYIEDGLSFGGEPFSLDEPEHAAMFEQILRGSGRNSGSSLRIAAHFARERMPEEDAAFVQQEFGERFRGFQFGQQKVAVGHAPDGMDIAFGDSVHSPQATLIPWKTVVDTLRDMLNRGEYHPQETLDRAADFVTRETAATLSYMQREIVEGHTLLEDDSVFSGVYPDKTDRLAELLKDSTAHAEMVAALETFAADYAQNRDLLRWHTYKPADVRRKVKDVQAPRRQFEVAPDFDYLPPQLVISQDEIDVELRQKHLGSKLDIIECFAQEDAAKERAAFVKQQYGITGGSYGDGFSKNYSAKGLSLSRGDSREPDAHVLVTWPQVAQRIAQLIASDRYLTAKDHAELPAYYAEQERLEIQRKQHEFMESVADLHPAEKRDSLAQRLTNYVGSLESHEEKHLIGIAEDITTEQMEAMLQSPPQTQKLIDVVTKIARNTGGVFARNHGYRFGEELQVLHSREYAYDAGQTVTMDGTQREIAFVDDSVVRLNNPDFPLVMEEIPRDVFEQKLATDEHNDHLLRFVQEDVPTLPTVPYVVIEFSESPHFAEGERLSFTEADLKFKQVERQERQERAGGGGYNKTFGKIYFLDNPNDTELSTYEFRYDIGDYNAQRSGLFNHVQNLWSNVDKQLQLGEYVGYTVDDVANIQRMLAMLEPLQDRLYRPAELQPKSELAVVDNEEPIAVGRLDFLDSNGEVVESIEYNDEKTFIAKIRDEDDYGGAFSIVVYRSPTDGKPLVGVNQFVEDIRPMRSLRYEDVPIREKPANFRITDNELGYGGAKAKFRMNTEAINLLKAVEFDGQDITPAEQEILSRYVGWGGIPQAFDPDNAAWETEYLELNALLSPEEHAAARASTLNAHYTSPTVIKAIYKAVENMGFTSGNILEPSCGVGNFFGLLPESMATSRLYGVELDPITGRIAQQLYPNADIKIAGFEQTDHPDSFFDLAIGNVPFGDYSVVDRRYDKHKFLIHDYFIAKTLDKVRPGGVVAFVTSKGTLDKQNPAVRKYLAQRAELLGAIRLPSNAFLKNAGTEVTSDIIFLQKRDRPLELEPDWIHLGQTEDGIPVNSYFVDNPHMVLGTMSMESTQYGKDDTTCQPFPDRDLAELLDEAVGHIRAQVQDYEREDDDPLESESIPADPDVRNFSFAIHEGQIVYRENSIMMPQEMSATAQSRVRGMIGIRDSARRLIDLQTEDAPDSEIQREQVRLGLLYDAFTAKYGLLNDRANATVFRDDGSYPLLCSLEVLDNEGKLKRKADMFSKRTIKPHAPVTHVDTAAEALAVSIGEKARVDLDFMAELSGLNEDALIADLQGVIFQEPVSRQWQTADEYLSGNVREKLRVAREHDMPTNIAALELAQPVDLTAAEISVRLGATWLPPDVAQDFMHELLKPPSWQRSKIQVHYSKHTAEWSITGKTVDRYSIAASTTYGTKCISAYHIIEQTLNLRAVRVFDTVYKDGKEERVLNPKETAIAQGKQEQIKQKFADWIWADPERRARLCALYNEQFNSIRPREYDGSHIQFVGMNPEITLDKHQVDAVARKLYGGNTLFAHEVGAGKTYTMIASAMESKRLGLCNKSLFVVPNNIVGQFASEFLQLYPSANVLMVTARDFEKSNRKKFCARIATGDYDGIVMAHSQFEKLPMSREWQEDFLQSQVNDISSGIADAKEQQGERLTVKAMERVKKFLQTRIQKLNEQFRKDDMLNFEQLGVDALYVDEADLFKNLMLVTKMRNVAGIGQSDAKKASDLFMKTRWLDDVTGRRGVCLATGTPISNTMAEMYTMQRYLQYDTLVAHGLEHFDCWASTFGETVTAMELAPEGTGFRMKTRFAKFYNLPELMAMFREVADIQTADMLNLPTPKVHQRIIAAKPSPQQKEMVLALAERAEKIRRREVKPTEDNMLLVTNDGRKLALDQPVVAGF